MFNTFDNFAGGGARPSGSSAVLDSEGERTNRRENPPAHGPTFSKIFRWQPSDLRAPIPASVELAGSFTNWQVETMKRDAVTNTWQITLHGIPGNRTHRYMLLVNGEPAPDKNCDGLAAPQDADEQRYQLMTARGPRVFLLFAQTK
jgi:hypothetical protein